MPLGVSKPWRACSSRLGRVCRLSPLSLSLPRIPRAACSSNNKPPPPPSRPTDPVVVSYSSRSRKGFLSTVPDDEAASRHDAAKKPAASGRVVPHSKASHLTEKLGAAASFKLQSGATPSLINRLESVPVRPHGALPVVVEPLDQYADELDARYNLKKHFRVLAGQVRMTGRRYGAPPDWRLILQNLVKSTAVYDPAHHTVKVIMGYQSLETVMRDFANNPWDMASWSGCRLAVCTPRNRPQDKDDNSLADSQKPFILLSGPSVSVTSAVNALLSVSQKSTVQKLWSGDERAMKHNWHYIPDSFKAMHIDRWYPVESYHLKVRVDEIPRPAPGTWTKEVFTNYVSAVVNGRVTDERKLYGDGTEYAGDEVVYYDLHRRAVVKLLMDLFADPETTHAVSHHGLKLALHYMGKNNIVDAALDLLRRGRDIGLRLDAAVFNLQSETAKNNKDMLAFETCLKRMLTSQVRPSFRTWRLFLDLTEAEEVKRYILQAMHTKRLLESRTHILGVVESMAGNDAYRSLQLGQNLDEFFRSQKEIYGPDWRLSTVSANKVITTFGSRGQFGLITQLVKYMLMSPPSAKCRPDNHTLAILLTHSQRHDRFDLAFQYISWFEYKKVRVDEKSKILTLFTMAWRNTLPHLACAIFRYAHFNNTIPWQIKAGVIAWLQDYKAQKRLTRRCRGLFKGGPDGATERRIFVSDLLFWDFKTAGESTGAATPQYPDRFVELPARERYRRFADWAWKVHQTHKPADFLVPFLCEALKKDYEIEKAAQMKAPYELQPVAVRLRPREQLKAGPSRRKPTDFSRWFNEQDIERVVQTENAGDGEGVWGSPEQGMGAEDEQTDFVNEPDKDRVKVRRVGSTRFHDRGVDDRVGDRTPAKGADELAPWDDNVNLDILNKEGKLPDSSTTPWDKVQQDIIGKFKDISVQEAVEDEIGEEEGTWVELGSEFKPEFQETKVTKKTTKATKKVQTDTETEPATVWDNIQKSVADEISQVGIWDQRKRKVRGSEELRKGEKVRVPGSGQKTKKKTKKRRDREKDEGKQEEEFVWSGEF